MNPVRTPIARTAALLALLACTPTRATPRERATSRAAVGPRPAVVLLRHSVWYHALDLPLVVAYEDGHVIYPDSTIDEIPVSYASAQLPATGADSVQRVLGIDADLADLPRKYDLQPGATDQETIFLYVRHGDSLVRFAMRGARVAADSMSDSIPAPLRSAYGRLIHFVGPAPTRWHPDSLYAYAWPYEYAPDDPPLQWPAGWPDLGSPATERRPDKVVGEIVEIPLPYSARPTLDSLLERRREKQAIGIGHRKWAVRYRMPFPGEDEWRTSFGDLEE